MKRQLLLVTFLFSVSTIHCMESSDDNHEMTSIKNWTDVLPFAGYVVAYKTNHSYFNPNHGYQLEDPTIKYGYIDNHPEEYERDMLSEGGKGYELHKLLKPNECPSNHALTNQHLRDAALLMRLAYPSEINAIRAALAQKKANFEYGIYHYTYYLNKSLDPLNK